VLALKKRLCVQVTRGRNTCLPHVSLEGLIAAPRSVPCPSASDDVVFTQQPDVGSSLVAPRWRDSFHPRQHVIYEPNLVAIVDVRALGGRSAAPIGWALLPIFEDGSEYIASGAFQLPLFQGRGWGIDGQSPREDTHTRRLQD